MRSNVSIQDRESAFWSQTDRSGDCWLFTGYLTPAGYGRFSIAGVQQQAHRVAYMFTHGPIPEGMVICHRCDVRHCVNPSHIFLGTHADNVADMDAKGRRQPARGDRNGARLHPETRLRGDKNPMRAHPELVPRGEKHGMAKLTDEQVCQIRDRYGCKEMSARALGPLYGVSKTTILRAVHGHSWQHVH